MNAYEELVARYQTLAFRTALLITRVPDDAEDVAQEGFVKAYYALDRFRDGAPFRPWLLQIVANEARNRRKSTLRRIGLANRVARVSWDAGIIPSPEGDVLADERRRALLEAVNTLRDEERTVVACRYFLDLSEAETADLLGWPKGTVKSRLSRALGRLRERLGPKLAIDDHPPGEDEREEQPAHG